MNEAQRRQRCFDCDALDCQIPRTVSWDIEHRGCKLMGNNGSIPFRRAYVNEYWKGRKNCPLDSEKSEDQVNQAEVKTESAISEKDTTQVEPVDSLDSGETGTDDAVEQPPNSSDDQWHNEPVGKQGPPGVKIEYSPKKHKK